MLIVVWLVGVLLIPVSGAAQMSAAQTYTIGPQDVLAITCHDDPQISGKYVVQADGVITLQLIGAVRAAGLTPRQLEDYLKKRYKDGGFLLNPVITVAVEQYKSQRVIIQGEVGSPGMYTLTGGMTLLELIAQAGSMTRAASGEIVIVRGGSEFIHADLSQMQTGAPDGAIPLRDGDLVVVHQAERAYLLGEVRSPNAYPVQRNTTLMQLLSLAGGPTTDAAVGRTKIVRFENGKRVEIKDVKFTDIIKPGDTVIVPTRYF